METTHPESATREQPRQMSEQWLRVLDLGVERAPREDEPLALRLWAGLVWSFS